MTPAAVVAAVGAGAGVLLLRPGRPRLPVGGPPAPRLAVLVAGGGAGVLLLGVTAGAQRSGAVALALAAVAGMSGLWRRGRRRKLASAVAARVLETCELLGAELAAGRPPGAALERAAAEWPPLAPAVDAFAMGSDVPEALRRVALTDGARDLRLLGAAWQVAHRTGDGLTGIVGAVAEHLRATQATRRIVESELASARATARLVAALPVPALFLGKGAGGDPWGFLLGTSVGLGCLALGLAFALAGLWWIESLAASVWEAW